MRTAKLRQLPRIKKSRTFDVLWADLVPEDEALIESPAWHVEELRRTGEHVRNRTEEILAWQDAKAELRKRFR